MSTRRAAARAPLRPRRCAIALAALAVLAALPYAQVIGFEFSYDDHWTIVRNRWLSAPAGELLGALLDGSAVTLGIPDATRPAMIFSLRLDRALFGDGPAGYHVHSLLLHVACVLLVFALAFALARRRSLAWLAAALFAVAPLHAEAVASVHYREDLLCALGVAGALALLSWPAPRPHGWARACLCAALFGLALLAKENALVLALVAPALLLVRGDGAAWRRRERSGFALLPVLVLWANWRWALWLRGDGLPLAPDRGIGRTLLETARYADAAVLRALLPLEVTPIHAPAAAGLHHAVLALALLAATSALLVRPATRVAGLGLLLALVLPLGSSPLAGPFNVEADRYLYLSSLGGALLWAQVLVWLGRRLPRPLGLGALALILAALGVQARASASIFRDDPTLWRAAVRAAPESPRAWTGLAYTLRKRGDLDGAERAVARARRLDADYGPARVTHVYNLLARRQIARARRELDALVAAGGAGIPGAARARRCLEADPAQLDACLDGDGDR